MELLSVFFWYLLPLNVYLSAYITMRKGLKRNDPKVAYSPPGWVIALIWLVLYMLQATAAWMLMHHVGDKWTFELTMYCVHLGLAFFYGPVFSKGVYKFTFFYTFVLFVYGAVVVGFFFKKYAWAGWLFLPTVVWLVFATWLSFSTYQNSLYIKRRKSRSSDDEEVERWEAVEPTSGRMVFM
jgi:tryptophan-rich sensory protein